MVPSLLHKMEKQWKNIEEKIPPPYRPFLKPAVGLLCLLLVGSLFFALRPSPSHWAVLLDGEVMGWVEDRQELEAALKQIQEEKENTFGSQVELAATLDFQQVSGRDVNCEEPCQLAQRLSSRLAYTVPAALIMVDGTPVAALKEEGEAQQVLKAVREQYLPQEEDTVLEEMTMCETVEIVPGRVPTGELCNGQEALRILQRGTDEVITHLVTKGESLWSIAREYDLTVADLKAANPDLKTEVLQIGQELDLVVPKPYLTIRTREKTTYTQAIPYPTRTLQDANLYIYERKVQEPGVAGSKEVTYEIVRENGQEVERELVAEEIIEPPVTQVVAMGTKMPEARGTGSLSWPLSRGSISSRYGMRRGRMHSGVDIAAPTGSPITAADSGVVTLAQWYGSYGRTVIIDHGNGVSTLYGHCSEILVRVGNKVSKGQLIARVGSTGRSTGPHLHFEVRENGRTRDPMGYFK
ncbi:MAG: M23 family metallopeptidase [Firmicutes bacterium]|nr:M23 family metallopeptidase [Bacillota bacterium]